jgi:hypothetical protein
MQCVKLLIAKSPTVLDMEFLSPEPEVESVELCPHSCTLSWRVEWT